MKNFKRLVFALSFIVSTIAVNAQISGTVYLDINNSGTRTVAPATPFEPGVFGVTVKAFNANGIQLGSTTTTSTGAYSLAGVTSFPVRLEFTTPDNQFSGKRPAAGQSNVQFIAATSSTANYAVGYNTMFTNNANPYVATNGSTNGNATANGAGQAGLRQNLFVTPYTLDNTFKTGANYQNQWLGSVFGITYQRETRTLLMAAYLKRHVGFGPGGIDAIYKTIITAAGDAAQPSILFELANLGINVGTDPRSVALPNNPLTPNTDLGVFGQVGKRGIGNIDLAENGKDLYVTNLFENKIHRINIGMPVKSSFSAADVTGNWTIPGPGLAGTEWHIMGIKYYQGKVYVGGVSSIQRSVAPVATAANRDADHVNLRGYVYELNPVTGTITEVMQFPFNYRRGFCNNDYRYEFKCNYWRAWQNNGDADILRADFNTANLGAITPNSGNSTGIYYPQPMLADIEFDVDGSIIIGVKDRFGDQVGYNNHLEGINGNVAEGTGRFFRGLNSGEILRAGKSGSTFTIENNASVTTNGIATTTAGIDPNVQLTTAGTWAAGTGNQWGYNTGAGQGMGPGGKYFYYNHSFSATGVPVANVADGSVSTVNSHYEKTNGGLALMAGYDELVNTAMDPDGRSFTSGLLRFSNAGIATGTNAGNMTDQQELIPGFGNAGPAASGDPSNMGKSNGMGDVEILLDAMPIEIGNRIWNDLNADGIQDANEAGISGVAVLLRSPGANGTFGDGDDQTWTVNTDGSGNYYFDNTGTGGNVNDSRATALGFIGLPTGNTGILNSQNYRIEIDPAQVALTGYRVAGTDIGGTALDNIDNDGSVSNLTGVGTRSFANVNTSNNDYNYDFGFTQKGALGNRAWLDSDADGTQDETSPGSGVYTEPGLSGISVTLFRDNNNDGDFDDAGELNATTVTDAYGNYFFNNLTTGVNSYRVVVTTPANYIFTTQTNSTQDAGTDANGSDINVTTGRSYNITLTTAEIENDIDAGLIFSQPITQSIGDRVWFDANNNGVDNNEPGVAGVVVVLFNGSGIPIASTITDANGYYNFTNLSTGSYQVGITSPAGFTFAIYNTGGGTLGDPVESNTDSDVPVNIYGVSKTPLLVLDAGENLNNVDIGLIATATNTASVGDFIWNDLDQDGIQDAGEPGIAGVTVTLYAADGTTVLATTVTDALGGYMFTGLPGATSYVVGITPPVGYTVSPQNAGGNLVDSDISTITFKTSAFNLPAGIRNLTLDAGLHQTSPAGTARLGDKVWFDNGIGGGTANDGIQNGTEPGVGGVMVILYRNGADGLPGTADDVLVGTTTTDANGNYQFVNLAASAGATTEYNVDFSNLPPGYSLTPVWSSNDANATNSDANPGTGRTGTINITAGESEQDVDAGLVAGVAAGKGSLGNKVFYDLPGGTNGIQDAGETGVAGVTVTLQKDLNNDGDFADAGEASFAIQTTNSLGEYLFTGLDAGNYRVVFSNGPAGYNISPANAGSNDAADSDGNNAGSAISSTTSTTGTINLAVGEDNLTVDLGIVKTSGTTGSISDRVWFDINNDGDRDATEPGIAGVTVTLYDASGAVLAVTTTDANGYYLFDNLTAKTSATDYYQVGFSNYPSGLVPTIPTPAITNEFSSPNGAGKTSQIINLNAGQNRTDVDFGLSSVRASLGNFVWLDSDGDGVQDAGEAGLPGVTVLLYYDANSDGDFVDAGENVASMITDQNGQYLFTNLSAGNYQVEFTTVPTGLNFTVQNTPGDNGINTNSDANSAGRTATIVLTAGEADLTIDAGLYKPTATVGNYIWADNNNNNVQDVGDQGVAGVLITLYTSAGLPVSTTVTDKNGQYLFTNVPPGNYYVGFVNTPNGSLFVIADQGGNDALDSDVNNTNGVGTTATFSVPQATVNITIDAGLVYSQSLPVRLQFKAYKRNTISELVWIVSGDITDAKNYVIERSADGRNYVSITSLQADTRTNYQQFDLSPLTGINYYRVRIEYIDGKIEYSEVRIIRFDSNGIIAIFPNPASSTINISLPDSWQGKRVNMEIINQLGQVVFRKSQSQASQVETIDITGLARGAYNLRLVNSKEEVEVRKLQVIR